MNELALFAGAGGGILGSKMLGWRTVCAVEYEQYAAEVLLHRQNTGELEAFPIWDDVRTFDGRHRQSAASMYREETPGSADQGIRERASTAGYGFGLGDFE